MHVIRRRGSEAYPIGLAAVGAATAALRNRNVAAGPISLNAPFTPSDSGFGSIIAAILFTPRVSGVLQVSSTFQLANGVDAEAYAVAMQVFTGTGLSVTGGEATSNGWVVGSTTPPIVGGAGAVTDLPGADVVTLAGGGNGALVTFGITQPQAVGTPLVLQLGLAQNDSHALAGIAAFCLSVLELP
jgi:hypothetical protein